MNLVILYRVRTSLFKAISAHVQRSNAQAPSEKSCVTNLTLPQNFQSRKYLDVVGSPWTELQNLYFPENLELKNVIARHRFYLN
jgi:hypothetical protein